MYTVYSSLYRTDLGTSIETFIVHMLLIKNLQFLPNDFETQSKSLGKNCRFFIKRISVIKSLDYGAQVCRGKKPFKKNQEKNIGKE